MKHRSAALALAVALVLPVAGGTVASAATLTHSAAGKSDHDKKSDSTKPVKGKKAKAIVYAGTVSAVDADASTLTLTVHGGRDKKLRNTSLTLTVPAGITIIRNGASSTLAAIRTGDRVRVQARQTAQVTTVTRIIAKSRTSTPDDDTPSTPVTPEPSPTA